MTEIQGPQVPRRPDAGLMLEDLACVCGTLSEIMTAWRRAMPWRPELPLSSLTTLQDTARQRHGSRTQESHRRRPGDHMHARHR